MKKFSLAALALSALALFGAPARADVVFDVTLTATSGSMSGTGTLWITGSIDPTYDSIGRNYSVPAGDTVKEFTITIDGHEFDLTNTFTNITFLSGSLWNVGFSAFSSPLSLSASDTTYTFSDITSPGTTATVGKITLSPHVEAAVPEPSTWAMIILGFCGIGFMAHRKRSARRFA